MNEDPNNQEELDALEVQVREAVERGEDINAAVERLSRDALAHGRVDAEGIREVIKAVGRGASEGAGAHGEQAREALSAALGGLEQALGQNAEAAKLSIEEAAGKAERFSREDLRRALNDLRNLEGMMLDTLSEVAAAGRSAGADILRGLADHGRAQGTVLGRRVDDSLRALSTHLPTALREMALAGLGAARETGSRLAEAAEGALKGVSDALGENKGRGDGG